VKRLAVVGSAVLLAACSSSRSSAHVDVFTGTWSGLAETTVITNTTTQQGSAITGTGTAVSAGQSLTATVTGTSTPPTVYLKMTYNDGDVVVFSGTYATPDSVVGIIANADPGDSVSAPFAFKRQQ